MNTVLAVIGKIIDGRKMGKAFVVKENGEWEVRAYVLNYDGCGKKDTLLASFPSPVVAVQVRNAVNALGAV